MAFHHQSLLNTLNKTTTYIHIDMHYAGGSSFWFSSSLYSRLSNQIAIIIFFVIIWTRKKLFRGEKQKIKCSKLPTFIINSFGRWNSRSGCDVSCCCGRSRRCGGCCWGCGAVAISIIIGCTSEPSTENANTLAVSIIAR